MFTGYTDQTVDVFWGIRFNNDRAWFAEHKAEQKHQQETTYSFFHVSALPIAPKAAARSH